MASQNKSWSLMKADPALLLALVSTGIYYSIILQPAMHDTLLAKYTSEHAVEYVIVTLFFWGMIDILLKLCSFPREYLATRHDWLPLRSGREPVSNASALLARVLENSSWLLASSAGRRIVQALSYVVEKGSVDDYREQVEHLADLDEQELHAKYTVLRFVIAVTPILGFLGTVVHFGTAIGSFSFDDMDARLPGIVGGMGTAFNTTSVALATAMTMMFALFLCERVDQGIVATIDRLIDRELLHRFENKDPGMLPLMSAIQAANRNALDSVTHAVQDHTKLWAKGLDALFDHFQGRQKQELAHQQEAFEALRQRHETLESAREEQFRALLAAIDQRQTQHWERVQSVLEQSMTFRQEVARLAETLDTIARGEGHLVELQTHLSDNLRLLHESSQIDSALHGLTAAIHLMTSRGRTTGRPDSAAA